MSQVLQWTQFEKLTFNSLRPVTANFLPFHKPPPDKIFRTDFRILRRTASRIFPCRERANATADLRRARLRRGKRRSVCRMSNLCQISDRRNDARFCHSFLRNVVRASASVHNRRRCASLSINPHARPPRKKLQTAVNECFPASFLKRAVKISDKPEFVVNPTVPRTLSGIRPVKYSDVKSL